MTTQLVNYSLEFVVFFFDGIKPPKRLCGSSVDEYKFIIIYTSLILKKYFLHTLINQMKEIHWKMNISTCFNCVPFSRMSVEVISEFIETVFWLTSTLNIRINQEIIDILDAV